MCQGRSQLLQVATRAHRCSMTLMNWSLVTQSSAAPGPCLWKEPEPAIAQRSTATHQLTELTERPAFPAQTLFQQLAGNKHHPSQHSWQHTKTSRHGTRRYKESLCHLCALRDFFASHSGSRANLMSAHAHPRHKAVKRGSPTTGWRAFTAQQHGMHSSVWATGLTQSLLDDGCAQGIQLALVEQACLLGQPAPGLCPAGLLGVPVALWHQPRAVHVLQDQRGLSLLQHCCCLASMVLWAYCSWVVPSCNICEVAAHQMHSSTVYWAHARCQPGIQPADGKVPDAELSPTQPHLPQGKG